MTSTGHRGQHRYDMGPVLAQFPPDVTITKISLRTTISTRQLGRWMREGLPFWAADRIATRLYRTPGELWPEWDRDEPSPVIVNYAALRQQEQLDRIAADAVRRSTITLPPPDISDIRSPGGFNLVPKKPPPGPPPRAAISDDLVYIYPEWLSNSPNPPGLPPRREDCTCACSDTDAYGRPVTLGFCGPVCERRPR